MFCQRAAASAGAVLLLAVSGCSPVATSRESGGSTHVLPGPGTSTRTLTIFWRSLTWIAGRQPTGRSSARCPRRAGAAARTTSNTRCPQASSLPTRSRRGTRLSLTSATHCARACSVTSAMRDHIPIHIVSPARRAVLCSPPIKVSRPITTQLAVWLNWTVVDECSGPRAPQILSIGICAHTVWLWSPNSTALSQPPPTCMESTVGRSVQVWRLSDLTLLHTVLLPPRTARQRAPSSRRRESPWRWNGL